MAQDLGKEFWESHWQDADVSKMTAEPNPHLVREVRGLTPGTALDAGCGEGAEAIWLASRGWRVTGADISSAALARAAERAAAASAPVQWVEADLSVWEPGRLFDLVTTHYAHPAIPQLAFYRRISDWVSPGGTLLIVGHLQTPDAPGHAHGTATAAHADQPFQEASVSVASVVALFEDSRWDIVTAEEHERILGDVALRDAVVRATRR